MSTAKRTSAGRVEPCELSGHEIMSMVTGESVFPLPVQADTRYALVKQYTVACVKCGRSLTEITAPRVPATVVEEQNATS